MENYDQIVDRLRSGVLLSAVGTPSSLLSQARVVNSWSDAITGLSDDDWANIRLEQREQYRLNLMLTDVQRWRTWNEVFASIQPDLDHVVAEAIRSVPPQMPDEGSLRSALVWDVASMLIEYKFADVVPVSFFAFLGQFYLAGHLPCGWDGPPPPGGSPAVF
jgi:hypothetical protein